MGKADKKRPSKGESRKQTRNKDGVLSNTLEAVKLTSSSEISLTDAQTLPEIFALLRGVEPEVNKKTKKTPSKSKKKSPT